MLPAAVSMTFEYPSGDLEFFIDEKTHQKQRFSASSLAEILADCVSSLEYLESGKMVHGNICPKFVGFIKKTVLKPVANAGTGQGTETLQATDKFRYFVLDRLNDPSSPVQC